MILPKTMKALVAYAKGDYRYEPAYPVPECGDNDIIIKTEACGVCAGDLKCYHGNSTWATIHMKCGCSRRLSRGMSSWGISPRSAGM